jgi:hypothetical protein
MNGLAHEWPGRVYANPPYSNVEAFVSKLFDEIDAPWRRTMNPPRIRIRPEVQAFKILEALAAWCSKKPGRRFQVEHSPDGWKVTLNSREASTGVDMTEALSQVATVPSLEVG